MGKTIWCNYNIQQKVGAVENRYLGGGGHIHMFVFTNCNDNRFQKELIVQNTNI